MRSGADDRHQRRPGSGEEPSKLRLTTSASPVQRRRLATVPRPSSSPRSGRQAPHAASSYYAAKARPPSAQAVNDATLKDIIVRVHLANFGVYGVRKIRRALARLGIAAGRDRRVSTKTRAVQGFRVDVGFSLVHKRGKRPDRAAL